MHFKTILKKIAVVAVTAVFAVQPHIQAFAASKPVYISDMLISYAKSNSDEDIAEAKKWLSEQGYTVLEQDLNNDTDNLFSKTRPVFLGYKTTSNVDEAITDMRLMNMDGDYSVDSYEQLLKAQKEEIELFLENTQYALQEYRENFSNVQEILDSHNAEYTEIGTIIENEPELFDGNCFRAMIAYENLNLLYDDDTGYSLGELLLSPIKEELSEKEYLNSSEAHADMTTIMLQANSVSVMAIMQALAYATDDTNDGETWLTRAEASDGLEGIIARYQEENPTMPISQVQRLIQADYDTTAGKLSEAIPELKELVNYYTSCEVSVESDADAIAQYFNSNPDESFLTWLNAGAVYEASQTIEVGGILLSDLLLSDNYNFSEQTDRALLYPIVDAMTLGQRSMMEYVTFDRFLINALNDDDAWAKTYTLNRQNIQDAKPYSLYVGVHREMFNENGGTALTKTAADHQITTNESYMENFSQDTLTYCGALLGVAAAATGAASLACFTVSKIYENKATTLRAIDDYYDIQIGRADSFVELDGEIKDIAITNPEEYFEEASGSTKYGVSQKWMLACKVMCIAAALMAVTSAVTLIISYVQSTNIDYKRIPLFMVHGKEQEIKDWETSSSWVYTYYSAVKCNRISSGFLSDNTKEMSDCGDLNGDVGRQWVALYVTKDKTVGNPINANSLSLSSEDKIPFGKRALSYFGEEYSANLSNPNYVFNDEAPAHYLYFSTSDVSATGTVTNSGTVAVTATLSALVGGVICYLITSKTSKKKEEEATA